MSDPAKYIPLEALLADRHRGLGDTIAKITAVTGIAKAVQAFSTATGIDCGCKGRQQKLNELFPYEDERCQ